MTRKSKRELASEVEKLEAGEQYPDAGLTALMGYEWTVVDANRRLIQLETGEVKYAPELLFGDLMRFEAGDNQ